MHRLAALALAASLSVACATPVGVERATPREVDDQLSASVLTGDVPSALSREYLERFALADLYAKQPREALARLHAGLGAPDEEGRLFALSELWFGAAQKSGDKGEYLASAIYAYAFLFPGDVSLAPMGYTGRTRLALDFYNRGITEGLTSAKNSAETELDLTPREIALPFGTFVLEAPKHDFTYGGYRISRPVSLVDVKIRGLRNRYRRSGIGAALAAQVVGTPGSADDKWMPPQAKIPVTAFVRLSRAREDIERTVVRGELELFDADESPSVLIGELAVPIEFEPSAALAYRLEGAPIWDFEIAGFRRPELHLAGLDRTKGLGFLNPYHRGRIPVVFVHGTLSSPARWAEMANELLGDPHIASHFQLWFFVYNSGNPVLQSAANLREALQMAVHDIDPDGTDPALRQIVVIGHSQGGLLTKALVAKSGTAFWDNISDVPFDKVALSADLKSELARAIFFDPLPFVTRVVFISTPHRGSFLAENWLGMFARRLISTPAAVTNLSLQLAQLNVLSEQAMLTGKWRPPTSIDNMDWSNPGLRTLASLPIAPGVHVHSIIPVKSEPIESGDDGVVRYQSAHIEPVDSELVITPATHSVQATPQAIEEVRRILYEHAGIQ
ncbi:MAG: esterase/lipase family protein [Myxococcota bacterium]